MFVAAQTYLLKKTVPVWEQRPKIVYQVELNTPAARQHGSTCVAKRLTSEDGRPIVEGMQTYIRGNPADSWRRGRSQTEVDETAPALKLSSIGGALGIAEQRWAATRNRISA